MKRFRSRLQSLHRLRDQQEQLARARVARCRQRQAAAEQRTKEIRNALDATSLAMNSLFTQLPGAETLNGTRVLYRRQQNQLHAAQQDQLAAVADMEQALTDWHATRAELKAISNRIDRQRANHRRDAFLHEEHRQQETVAQASFRRMTSTVAGIGPSSSTETRGITES